MCLHARALRLVAAVAVMSVMAVMGVVAVMGGLTCMHACRWHTSKCGWAPSLTCSCSSVTATSKTYTSPGQVGGMPAGLPARASLPGTRGPYTVVLHARVIKRSPCMHHIGNPGTT